MVDYVGYGVFIINDVLIAFFIYQLVFLKNGVENGVVDKLHLFRFNKL